jgi:hypothetical protein
LVGADALGRAKVDELEMEVGIKQHVLHTTWEGKRREEK